MATKKETTESQSHFMAVPASQMGWQNFPLTDAQVCRDLEAAFEQKLSEGWVLATTITRNVGHTKDKHFFLFQRTAA